MDRILIILKKENGPRASSAPALGLNTIIYKHVYWCMYMQQISGERLHDHWSSGLSSFRRLKQGMSCFQQTRPQTMLSSFLDFTLNQELDGTRAYLGPEYILP